MQTYEQLTPARVQAAYDEATRELGVRSRCYAKWVSEGKISRTEATQRFAAQQDIVTVLAAHPSVTVNTDFSLPAQQAVQQAA